MKLSVNDAAFTLLVRACIPSKDKIDFGVVAGTGLTPGELDEPVSVS